MSEYNNAGMSDIGVPRRPGTAQNCTLQEGLVENRSILEHQFHNFIAPREIRLIHLARIASSLYHKIDDSLWEHQCAAVGFDLPVQRSSIVHSDFYASIPLW